MSGRCRHRAEWQAGRRILCLGAGESLLTRGLFRRTPPTVLRRRTGLADIPERAFQPTPGACLAPARLMNRALPRPAFRRTRLPVPHSETTTLPARARSLRWTARHPAGVAPEPARARPSSSRTTPVHLNVGDPHGGERDHVRKALDATRSQREVCTTGTPDSQAARADGLPEPRPRTLIGSDLQRQSNGTTALPIPTHQLFAIPMHQLFKGE